MIVIEPNIIYNEQAEVEVLGAMLSESSFVEDSKLGVDNFYKATHKVIFEAMLKVREKQRNVDIITVMEELTSMKKLDDIGGLGTLMAISNKGLKPSLVQNSLTTVKEKSLKRKVLESINEIYDSLSSEMESGEIIASALEKFGNIETNKDDDNTQRLDQVVQTVIEDMDKNSSKTYAGLETGYIDFDEITGGLRKSTFNVLAARPAMGKTAFALNLARRQADKGKTVLVFSLEMGKEELTRRIISGDTGIEGTKLSNPSKLDVDSDWDKIWETYERVANVPMYINDQASMKPMDILRVARDIKRKHGLDIIFVDYLQLAEGNTNNSDRQQVVAEVSRKMKMIAKELDIPVVALSQLSRSVESRVNKRPMLSDLRESGSIEQDADLVMFLYRDEYYNPDTEVPNTAELIIAKHRAGPVGTINLFFDANTTTFRSLSQRGMEYA